MGVFARRRPRVGYYSLVAAVFASSWLLFTVEPLSAKQLLPRLGGSPAVWITCLLFFQATLLAGYAYSHVSIHLLGLKRQVVLHVALLLLSLAFLPLAFDKFAAPIDDHPSAWLFASLGASIGLPFLLLSSFGPLAQRWLAHLDASSSADPYYLYAASNVGSLVALLGYPILIEPFLKSSVQAAGWSAGYAIMILAVVCLGAVVLRKPELIEAAPGPRQRSTVRPATRACWVLYAAIPSSLLMGSTSYVSTDIVSFPLLWVVPLSLYLLSFMLVFARRRVVSHQAILKAEPQAIVLVALTMYWSIALPDGLSLLLHLSLLFLVAMACHGELVSLRPETRHLTEFYFWLAAGGLIGGVFNALVAPLLFDEHIEYPIAIVMAAALRPQRGNRSRYDVVAAVAFGASLALLTWRPGAPPQLLPTATMVVFGVLLFSFRDHPARFALSLAFMFSVGAVRMTATPNGLRLVQSRRSFFGVYRVLDNPAPQLRTLVHGSTIHGAQSLVTSERLEPLTYYNALGPAGDILTRTMPAGKANRRIAVVGLGIGSLACYGRTNETWTYYEIDKLVAQIAMDSTQFTLLRDCPPRARFVFGDARLRLTQTETGAFDILIIDAFSSDAIPVHLLTREAVKEYLRVLAPGGVLAVHISNDNLELAPVVAALMTDAEVAGRIRVDEQSGDQTSIRRSPSEWAVLAREPDAFGDLANDRRWKPLNVETPRSVWTDDFSNILSAVVWR